MRKLWKPALAGFAAAVLAATMLPMAAFAAQETTQETVSTPTNQNLLSNPGFEDGITGWGYSDTELVTDNVHSGQKAFRGWRLYPGTSEWASQTVKNLQKGKYELSAYVDSRGSEEFFHYGGFFTVNGERDYNFGDTHGWKKVSKQFTVDTDGESVTIGLNVMSGLFDGETVCYFDDISLIRVEEPPTPTPPTNYIKNPGFESKLLNWNQIGTLSAFTTDAVKHAQSNSLMINQFTYGPMTDYLSQDIAVHSAGTYQLSGWLLTSSPMEGTGGAMLIMEAKDAVGTLIASKTTPSVLDTGNVWKQVSASLDVPKQAKTITVKIGVSAATGTFYADDMRLTDD